jgi:hypothetical protein
MLTDWEKDIWTRVFIKVDRHAVVNYTFDRQLASNQKFSQSFGMVDKTLFRQEEKQDTPKKGPKEALIKKEPATPQEPTANLKRRLTVTVEPNKAYFSDAEDQDKWFYLRLMNEKNQEVGQLRSDGMQQLKNIANDIVIILRFNSFFIARRTPAVYQPWAASDGRAA